VRPTTLPKEDERQQPLPHREASFPAAQWAGGEARTLGGTQAIDAVPPADQGVLVGVGCQEGGEKEGEQKSLCLAIITTQSVWPGQEKGAATNGQRR